mmetsp:Transcript_19217/g.33987  ORF Transcript_19217/g.33987 Transcript_19217/m.33987 type:complete len:248 (-) Transcript_19217:739-1482(-)
MLVDFFCGLDTLLTLMKAVKGEGGTPLSWGGIRRGTSGALCAANWSSTCLAFPPEADVFTASSGALCAANWSSASLAFPPEANVFTASVGQGPVGGETGGGARAAAPDVDGHVESSSESWGRSAAGAGLEAAKSMLWITNSGLPGAASSSLLALGAWATAAILGLVCSGRVSGSELTARVCRRCLFRPFFRPPASKIWIRSFTVARLTCTRCCRSMSGRSLCDGADFAGYLPSVVIHCGAFLVPSSA